jgi:hypothetical protein
MSKALTALLILLVIMYAALAATTRFNASIDGAHRRTATILAMARKTDQEKAASLKRRLASEFAAHSSERFLANWLYSLQYVEPVRVSVEGTPFVYTAGELLFNTRNSGYVSSVPELRPWDLFRALHYDQLPLPLLEVVLRNQVERYGHYLDARCWPLMQVEDWEQLPAPIQKIAAYGMVWRWAGLRSYEQYGLTQSEAARLLISVGITESMFDIDKIDNENLRTGNVDRG